MNDIVERVDRLKAIAAEAQGRKSEEGLSEAETVEVFGIALDFVGELIANSRRIAVALENLATDARAASA